MLQYFTAEQTFFKYFFFPSTIADATHIQSIITLIKLYLSIQSAYDFNTPNMATPFISFFYTLVF